MWDLIVSVPDHCLSFYFPLHIADNFDDVNDSYWAYQSLLKERPFPIYEWGIKESHL